MSRLTAEEHAAGIIRTDAEISTAFSNLIARKGTMSIPVQREDDDIVIGDALKELRKLRAVYRAADCAGREYAQDRGRIGREFMRAMEVLGEAVEEVERSNPTSGEPK